MAIRILSDYPAPPGNKRWVVADIDGPASYTAITPGTPPTGGQVVRAGDIGLQNIEWAQVSGSDNGQYDGVCYIVGGLGNPAKAAGTQFQLQWITAATGAEAGAVNLSARSLRIVALGL
jgi:hypothetical protein